MPKRLELLHELLPQASRVAVLVNPRNSVVAGDYIAGRARGRRLIELPIDILKASTSREIEEAFATIMRERVEALFIGADEYFASRRVQLLTLATRHGIASSYSDRNFPEAGGLMSYGTDLAEMYRQMAPIRAKSSRAPSPPTYRSCS